MHFQEGSFYVAFSPPPEDTQSFYAKYGRSIPGGTFDNYLEVFDTPIVADFAH